MNDNQRSATDRLDPGFDAFRADLQTSFPGMSDRTVGEAWMRNDVKDLPAGSPAAWRHMPGTLTVQIAYKAASISAAIRPSDVDGIVAEWASQLSKYATQEPRVLSRGLVVEGLATNQHNDRQGALLVLHAAIWLIMTLNPTAQLSELVARGDAQLLCDITDLAPGKFNFRMGIVDLHE